MVLDMLHLFSRTRGPQHLFNKDLLGTSYGKKHRSQHRTVVTKGVEALFLEGCDAFMGAASSRRTDKGAESESDEHTHKKNNKTKKQARMRSQT